MPTTNIDATFDSVALASGTDDETGTQIRVAGSFGATEYRAQFRFPLTDLATATSVTDSTIQFDVEVEDIEANEGVNVQAYNGTGDDDPDADTAANKYSRSGGGATLVTIDCSSTGSKTGDLTATADAQILGNVSSPAIYSLGFNHQLMDSGESILIEAIENAGSDPATLTVVWAAASTVRALAALGVGT